MAARAESFPLPSTLARRLLAPALPWALLTTLFVVLRARLLQPRLPRMSEEWLQNLERHPGTLE